MTDDETPGIDRTLVAHAAQTAVESALSGNPTQTVQVVANLNTGECVALTLGLANIAVALLRDRGASDEQTAAALEALLTNAVSDDVDRGLDGLN